MSGRVRARLVDELGQPLANVRCSVSIVARGKWTDQSVRSHVNAMWFQKENKQFVTLSNEPQIGIVLRVIPQDGHVRPRVMYAGIPVIIERLTELGIAPAI